MTANTSQTNKSWDKYWQGTGDIAAFTSGGVSHPAIRAFWIEFFNSAKQNYSKPSLIDIASGNGAVVESALAAFNGKQNQITSLDISGAAIENINSRFPTVKGIVADACSIPRESGSFTVVTSQFGVEYAGQDAIYEAARLVSTEGLLALLLHYDSGTIHQECEQSLNAIKRLQNSQFIVLAIEMFTAGFKAVQGGPRSAYESAAKKLAPAINELEAIMNEYGQHVAGDTIVRIYNDVGEIHQRIQHYDPGEILNWLKTMEGELDAYAKRMSSMSHSAINSTNFNVIKVGLIERGFSIERAETLLVQEHDFPMAWILIAKKTG
ncbi:MAG: methyltransferase domain-containing protein [Paraglaciecola sp.]|nr:methyltransferase domain-containing protein [Paraglaciecola sp.]